MRINNCEALKIGFAGMLITLTLNAVGYLALKHPAALPFHDQWWSSWFPIYAVWFIFLLIGASLRVFSNDAEKDQT